MPSHPLLRLVGEEASRSDIERAIQALDVRGWSGEELQMALLEAEKVAGSSRSLDEAPYVDLGEESPPSVSFRLPVNADPRDAAHLSSVLRERLASADLLAPGVSFAFRST